MENILDYNPEFIYYKNGERRVWAVVKKSAGPLYTLIFFAAFVYFAEPFGQTGTISKMDYFFMAFISMMIIVAMFQATTQFLWTINGQESIALLPDSLLISKELYRRHELVIPFKDIKEAHWHHSLTNRWLRWRFDNKSSYNSPNEFDHGKLEIRLKNGGKYYIGEDFSKEEFQRLVDYFPCYYLKRQIS